ncbi:MAG: DNA mismatch repair endonuclease MutL [bacterium]
MNKIKILSEKEAQKVAAGEVVERPANIVKETLENSIDAGSTQISLYIKESGKKLIRIQDNGCGMSYDDAKLCFATHATSKINSLDDLENITSFGFRGEALASISAVSKVTLKTKLKEDESVQQDPSIHTTSCTLMANEKKEITNNDLNNNWNLNQVQDDNYSNNLLCHPELDSGSSNQNILNSNNHNLGIKIEYSQNKLLSEEQISMPAGTDLEIEDLFYNIPVRKKFLKQDETEWNQILNTFQAFCLSNINIHFKLFKDDRLIINAPATEKLQERTTQLWGHNFSQNLISLISADPKHYGALSKSKTRLSHEITPKPRTTADKNDDIKFNGLISNHNFWRYGKQQIFFFVNGRYVKDIELNKSLLKGYTGVLPVARFPAAFIFLNVPSNFVDINVHPKKEEVRFIKPVTVTNYLQRLVKETLDNNVRKIFANNDHSIKPFDKSISTKTTSETQDERIINNNHFIKNNDFINNNWILKQVQDDNGKSSSACHPELVSGSSYQNIPNSETIIRNNSVLTSNDFYNSNQENHEHKLVSNILRPRVLEYEKNQTTIYNEKKVDTRKEFKILGQFLRTYIIIQSDENLILVDQHDAHERVIYDRITKNFENHAGIKLMFPEIIELTSNQIEQIKQAQEFLSKQGIETEFFGKNQLAIKSSPPKIQNQSLKELMFEILEFIKENEKLDPEVFRKKLNDRVHAQISCKSAVKSGDTLTTEEMQKIVDELYQTENPLTCPHGRPTTWIISKQQIEKQFKRDYKG